MRKKTAFALFAVVSVCIALFMSFQTSADSLPDTTKVESILVYNLENDRVLFEKNPDVTLYPASFVKMMTGIIACESYAGNTEFLVTVSKESLGNYQGKNIGIKKDEIYSVNDLLYATICGGANDAANVLAYEIAGSHEAFVEKMNAKAQELGMKKTLYRNPNGYTEYGMVSTANDTLKLAKYCYENPVFAEICSATAYTIQQNDTHKNKYVVNSNYLISAVTEHKYRNSLVSGMNAGSTTEGGDVLTAVMHTDGLTTFFIGMGGQNDENFTYTYVAANAFFKWARSNFDYKTLLSSNEMIKEVGITLSAVTDHTIITPAKDFEFFVQTDNDYKNDVVYETEIYNDTFEAPVPAGMKVGIMTIKYKGEKVGEVDLVIKNEIKRSELLYFLKRVKEITSSGEFIIGVIVFILIVIFIFSASSYRKKHRKTYRYRYRTKRH